MTSMTRTRRAVFAVLLAGLASASPAEAARTQDVTWHGTQIRLYDGAQQAGRYGSGVLVAVLDSWVDVSHPDFQGRALAGVDCTSGTCKAGQGKDSCTHGTHVAGTVAATSFGVATKAKILPVRVLTADSKGECTGTPDDVAAGIRYAIAQGAKVLNLSLGPDVPGLGSNSAIPTAVAEAAQAGAVVVFSAGNADLPVAQAYGNNALVVAATGPNGQLATYSQHGDGVSVAAPGGQPRKDSAGADVCAQSTCVTSLYPGNQYAVAAGTSMAAPHVSGIAALLFGQQPSRSRQDVMNRITGTARPLAGAGSGLVDARAALGVSSPTPKPAATTSPAPKPAATKPPVRTQTTQPPATVRATPRATAPVSAKPSVVPTPVGTSAAPSLAPVPEIRSITIPDKPDSVPVPLAVFATSLVSLAAASVIILSLKGRQ